MISLSKYLKVASILFNIDSPLGNKESLLINGVLSEKLISLSQSVRAY